MIDPETAERKAFQLYKLANKVMKLCNLPASTRRHSGPKVNITNKTFMIACKLTTKITYTIILETLEITKKCTFIAMFKTVDFFKVGWAVIDKLCNQYPHANAIGSWPEVVGCVISCQDVESFRDHLGANLRVAGFSCFRENRNQQYVMRRLQWAQYWTPFWGWRVAKDQKCIITYTKDNEAERSSWITPSKTETIWNRLTF